MYKINNNTLRLIIINESCKYFWYQKKQLNTSQEQEYKDTALLYCDNLEDKSIIRSIQYNHHGLTQKGNILIYNMDLNTLSELKKCILKTNCNVIEIADCDTKYDKSSKYGYFVEMCESLDKFKTLVYIM